MSLGNEKTDQETLRIDPEMQEVGSWHEIVVSYHCHLKKAVSITLFFVLFSLFPASDASAWVTERRRPQFSKEPGHLIIPVPYSINGIGEGIMLLGAASNVKNTSTDVFGLVITGDLEGFGAGFNEYHIYEERLFADMTFERLNKVIVQAYEKRGMDTSKDDYVYADLDEFLFSGGRMTLSYRERLFELYAIAYDVRYKLNMLRDIDGRVITGTTDSAESHSNLYGLGAVVDLTDDKSDPRRGIRLDTSFAWSPPNDDMSSDYYVMDNNLTLYLPIGKRSTWAFNYFQSDAHILSEGVTDRTRIYDKLGFECELITDPAEQAECYATTSDYIDSVVNANLNGTSKSLGGRSRLRSYPEDRFKGGHSAFVGTEFRWNITEEITPFDIALIKDIRTGVQLAVFYEIGTVAESQGGLWDRSRYSAGAGLRVVNASGIIYRIDYATGDEGGALTIIINYPWEAF